MGAAYKLVISKLISPPWILFSKRISMAALRLDGIFPEINETGIMPGLFEMEGQIGIVFQGNNDAFFISFYILDVDRFFE